MNTLPVSYFSLIVFILSAFPSANPTKDLAIHLRRPCIQTPRKDILLGSMSVGILLAGGTMFPLVGRLVEDSIRY